jgi:hypothetical protein
MLEPNRLELPTFEYSRADLPGPAPCDAFIAFVVDDTSLELVPADTIPALFYRLRLEAEAGAP